MHIPGMNFGERQALALYAKRSGMTAEEMVRECISEMAWEIAYLAEGSNHTACAITGRSLHNKPRKRTL